MVKDGGAAFPSRKFVGGHLDTIDVEGMTLRDYFAAAVLPAVMRRNEEAGFYKIDIDAADAYELADAMLKARDAK